ncbi:glycosyltransferase family 2 protein [Citricoccus muralis]|uniref:Glycosyl transferase family 2 n=1 Tax=Citricoccus muralis TaxID=169134 RepID=A0A3D9LF60_9MICC|nr:glycosyltransferase family 2 protein [Citricoccus muralis]REE04286.1 glycosyl transferase family 2 [Citricoccus muralis]
MALSSETHGSVPVPAPKRELVSVVIPARDDAVLLDRCLRALAQQTVAPAEVIVVDNASEDTTAAVAAFHGARVLVEPTVGIWAAAATGYDAAEAPVIARLDADSLPRPDWVEQITEAMAQRPEAAAVTGWGRFVDLPRLIGIPAAAVYLGAYYALGYAASARAPLWGSNMAIRRSVWREVRGRVHRTEREVHDDMDLALALGPHHIVATVPRIVVGVSARSLRGMAQLGRRFHRALRTLSLNWSRVPPWKRWALRFGWGVRHAPH